MNNENEGAAPVVLGLVGLICAIISFFVCWWLGIVGAVLGLIGLCLPGKGKWLPAISMVIGFVSVIIFLSMINSLF